MIDLSQYGPVTEEDREFWRRMMYSDITDEEILICKADDAETNAHMDALYHGFDQYALDHITEFGLREPEVTGPITEEERQNFKGFTDGEIFVLRWINLDNKEQWMAFQAQFSFPRDPDLAVAMQDITEKALTKKCEDEEADSQAQKFYNNVKGFMDAIETDPGFVSEMLSHLGEDEEDSEPEDPNEEDE